MHPQQVEETKANLYGQVVCFLCSKWTPTHLDPASNLPPSTQLKRITFFAISLYDFQSPVLLRSSLLDQLTPHFLPLLFAWNCSVITIKGGTAEQTPYGGEEREWSLHHTDPVGLLVPPTSSNGKVTCVSLMHIITKLE